MVPSRIRCALSLTVLSCLADITGDGNLELILRAGTSDHMDPVRVFTVTESQELLSPHRYLAGGSCRC